MKALVLGAGVQGRVVAAALRRRGATVTLADLAPPPDGMVLDARDADAVTEVARGHDVAVTTLPAAIGTVALPALLTAAVPTVDVSFTVELPFELDEAARRARVPVFVDFGIAPGLSHVLAAALMHDLAEVDSLRILVGGLPLDPPPVFRHAVYFHALDLVDEYLRPARVRRDGHAVAVDPLTESSRWVDEQVGEVEAFASDGLRSLLASFPGVTEMEELTLRAPGHLDLMRDLRTLGMFDAETVAATAAAFQRRFPGAEHPDRVLMEVQARRGDETHGLRVYVEHQNEVTAMSRATAFTAAAGAVVLAEQRFDRPGVHPPEALGADAAAAVLAELERDGIHVERAIRLRQQVEGCR